MTSEQEKEILALLVDEKTEQLKIKGCLWTRSIVELIKQKYGIAMPVRTVGEYLRRWELTVQRPAKWEANQKPEQAEVWLEEKYPAIPPRQRLKTPKFTGEMRQPPKIRRTMRVGMPQKGEQSCTFSSTRRPSIQIG